MRHVPVLKNEVIAAMALLPNQNVIDGTVGDGGHTEEILAQIGPNGRVMAIDADAESLARAKNYLYDFGERVVYVRDNFANLAKIVAETDFGAVNGILLDLGWSKIGRAHV